MENGNQPIAPCAITRYVNGDEIKETFNGLTKHEYFAAMAMSSILSNPEQVGGQVHFEWVSKTSVGYADALLAELEKPRQ